VDRADWLGAVQHVITKGTYTDPARANIIAIFAPWLRSMPQVRRVYYEAG
jgi:hypothetical protein